MSRSPRALSAFAVMPLLALVLAGCLAEEREPQLPVPDDLLDADVLKRLITLDHDHSERASHGGMDGLDLIGFASGYEGETPAGASFNEVAANGDLAFLSRGAPAGGFAVIDLADPLQPTVVGEWAGEPGFDIEVTHDGRFVLFATQRNGQPLGFPDSMVSAPTDHLPRGLYLVDVTTPAAPKTVSFFPHPWNGVHTMEYMLDDKTGIEFVVIQTYDLGSSLVPHLVPGQPMVGVPAGVMPATQRVTIAKLDREAAGGPRIVPLGVYQVHKLPDGPDWLQDPLYFPHDSHVERHPVTGRLLMYVAYWDAGLRIVDIEDPAQPKEIAAVTEFAPSRIVSLHDVKTIPVLIGGRHITVTGPEIVTADETGQFTFFDTTDPTKPERLGYWSLPGEDLIVPTDQPFLFSPHVFYIDENGVMVVGHNHGGVWMVDVSTNETLLAPKTIGYAFPVESLPDVAARGPSVWAAMWWNGYVLASDGPSGLYVYEPTRAPSAAPADEAVAVTEEIAG